MDTDQELAALRKLAKAAKEGGDRPAALAYFQAMLAVEPDNLGARLDIATELVELGQCEPALELLRPLETSEHHAGRIHHLLGRIYQSQGSVEEAWAEFKKGIKSEPDFLFNYLALANDYLARADLDAADAILEQGLQTKADPYWLKLLQVRLTKARGLVHLAIQKAQALLQNRPGDFHLSTILADYLIKLGRVDEAKSVLDQIKADQPDQHFRIEMLGARLALSQYQLDQAIAILRGAIEKNPKAIEAYDLLNLIYLMRCDLVEAKSTYEQTVKLKEAHLSEQVRANAKGGMNFMRLLDFGTNPFALKMLHEARALPLVNQPKAIADLLEKEPGHLGSAITLLTILRQCKIFNPISLTTAQGQRSPIPKKIVQFWDEERVPADIAFVMSCTQLNNPNFEYQLFNDKLADAFIAKECSAKILRAYRSANHPAMRADVFRLAYLWVYGGVYIDADDRALQALDSLLGFEYELLLMQEMDGSIGNNFMAVCSQHPWIASALETITQLINDRQGDNIWLVSGPGAISASLVNFYRDSFSQSQMPRGVKILPQYLVERFIGLHLPFRYKKGGGHWTGNAGRQKIYRIPLAP